MSTTITLPITGYSARMIGNCVPICLNSDEVGTGTCMPASIALQVTSNNTNLNGEFFTIAGYTFIIDNTLTAPSGNYLPWNQATTQLKAENLKAAILQHPGFNGQVTIGAVVGSSFTISWIECGIVEGLIPDFTNLSYPPIMPAGSQGTEIEYIEGFKFIYQLYAVPLPNTEQALCEILPLTPIIDGVEGEACVDLKSQIAGLLNAGLPIKTLTKVPLTNFIRTFKVKYGSVYNDYPCGVNYGSFVDSPTFKVAFSLEQATTWADMAPYMFATSAEVTVALKKILFLTKRPYSSLGCILIPEVVNVVLNLDEVMGLAAGSTTYTLYSQVNIDGAGWGGTSGIAFWTGDNVYQVPASPTELGLTPSGDKYEYRIYITANNATLGGPVIITEQKAFLYGKDCNTCNTAIYFLDDTGCWGAVRYNKLVAHDYGAEAETIETRNDCMGSDRDKALPIREGGKNLYNVKAGDIFTYRTDGMDKKEGLREWLMQFRRSPVHYIRYASFALSEGFRKVILIPNTVRITEQGEKIFAEFQFTYNNEDKVHDYAT